MKNGWTKLAGSSLALATLAIGCTPTANLHPDSVATTGPKAAKLAARSAAQAQARLDKHQPMKAVGPAEIAVAAAPENVGYRVILGQAYLQSGRFASAATALGEALSLDPANAKAGLNLSLAQSALGRREAAQATLAQVRGGVAAPDLGLALALAGAHEDAINLLATEARTNGATPKIRQNLAFALAIAGRWVEARAVAAQDLDPNMLDQRLGEWAALATPKSSVDQVATVLGVRPVADPGEPSMLALAQPAAPVAVADASPVAPSAPQYDMARFVAVAAADAPSGAPRISARKGYPALKPSVAEATPKPALAAAATRPVVPKLLARKMPPSLWPKAEGGEFVVQLGAFSRPERVQAAWATASDDFLRKAAFMPSSMTFSGARNGKLIYRLSIAGFKSRGDAQTVCDRIHASGRKCFVRAAQGDRVASWARQGGAAVASAMPVKSGGQSVTIALVGPVVRQAKPKPTQVALR